MLEPRQIRGREFNKSKLFGCDQSEVVSFLNSAADAMEELLDENNRIKSENIELFDDANRQKAQNIELENQKASLKAKIDTLLESISRLESDEAMVKEAIMAAQQKGEDIVATAKDEANRLIAQGEQILQQAQNQADQLLAQANQEAQDIKSNEELLYEQSKIQAEQLVEMGKRQLAEIQREGESYISNQLAEFQERMRSDMQKWQAADRNLRMVKSDIAHLLQQMPDGLDAKIDVNAKDLWEKIKVITNKETI